MCGCVCVCAGTADPGGAGAAGGDVVPVRAVDDARG